MTNQASIAGTVPGNSVRGDFEQVALVLQGGGALGAYQAGVYEALAEAGCEPDWVAGISIGAINAAIIAGNAPDQRLDRLRQFWELATSSFVWPVHDFGEDARRLFNHASAAISVLSGEPGFYRPRFPPAPLQPRGSSGALSFYDTDPLRRTLEQLIDFGVLNAQAVRLSLGAVNVRLGNSVYFDSLDREISVDHVMASGALPPGFPPIQIEGEYYWDGGLVSNTPLSHVMAAPRSRNTLAFQIDIFSARGELPRDLFEVEARRKQIVYSSRTRLNTDVARREHELRRAIVDLFERLPPEERQKEHVRKLRDLGVEHTMAIVHLIYRRASYEGPTIDYEFSRASMKEHWQAGLYDGRRTLRRPLWTRTTSHTAPVQVFDLTGEPGDD